MELARITLFVALLMAMSFGQAAVKADQVDDLLAGKPVEIELERPASNAEMKRAPQADGQAHASVTENAPGETWEVSLAHSSHAEAVAQAISADEHSTTAPPGMLSVVPEPSAVALAALALVYFLIFFRRRYSY